MRIEAIELLAYGHYAGTTLDLTRPEHGLTVVHGPNEAGKSTARRALLAALFGFDPHGPDGHRFGRHGLHIAVRLRGPDGSELAFVRQGQKRVTRPDGTDLDPDAVAELCHGIGRDLYTRLFSIDHEELRRGSASLLEPDGEIGRLVFGASLGSGTVTAVLQRLDARAAALFLENGRAQQVTTALKSYRELLRNAKDARVRSQDWDRLVHEVDEAELAKTRVQGDYARARRTQERLTRIRATRPLLARRAHTLERLLQLGTVPSKAWAERAAAATDAYRTARAARSSSAEAQARLSAQVEGAGVDEELLAQSDRIDGLVEDKGRYLNDTGDLPKRQAELDAELDNIAAQRQRLGHTLDDQRLVPEIALGEIEALVQRHVELAGAQRTAREELRSVRAQIAAANKRLEELEVPPDTDALERILRLARPSLHAARDLASGQANQRAAAADLDARAGRLGLLGRAWGDIEGICAPAEAEIEAERRRRETAGEELTRTRQECGRRADEIRALEEEMAKAAPQVPDPERLAAARTHRDAGWRVVRHLLLGGGAGLAPATEEAWGAGAPLADAFEGAVADADRAADERYDHAKEISTHAERVVRLSEARAQLDTLRARERVLLDDTAAAEQTWADRWTPVGVDARSPETMAVWRREVDKLIDAMREWRQRDATVEALAGDVHVHVGALTGALRHIGIEPCSEALDQLVSQADEVLERARRSETARRTATTERRLAEDAEPSRLDTLNACEAELANWQEAWEPAMRALYLGPSTSPHAALAAVAAYRGLATARAQAESLERRIAGIARNRQAYEQRVTDVARAVSPDLDDTGGPLEVVSALQLRLAHARDAHQHRTALIGELERATANAEEGARCFSDACQVLAALRREAGLGPGGAPAPATFDEGPDLDAGAGADADEDGVIDAVAARAREAASLRDKVNEIETDLLNQGNGMGIEQLTTESEAEGESADGIDSLGAAIDAAGAEVGQLTERLQEASVHLADARRRLDSVSGAGTAVDLEQDAQGSLALASELAHEYARTALAAEVLRRTIARYGDQHRGPLLDRAGALFSDLTAGAFSELRAEPDGDHQILLARRRGGELCSAMELSDGTRDQLYLALRLGGLEHQLALLADPLPVVLDDILVHFDDTRAAAALRTIGTLARDTQIVLFTHHEQVVELAQRELGTDAVAVVRLAPRDQDLAPTSVVGGGPRPSPTRRGGGREASRSVESRLLEAAHGAHGVALSKAELLERSGTAESQWAHAIRALVDRGELVQEGQKRGARYRPAT